MHTAGGLSDRHLPSDSPEIQIRLESEIALAALGPLGTRMLSARDLHPSGKALISLAASSNVEIDLFDGYLNQ